MNIDINWDSLEEVSTLLGKVKSRYIDLLRLKDPSFISKKDLQKQIFNTCLDLVNTDISSVYDRMNLDTSKNYYVYAHCDPGFKIATKKAGKSTFAATLGCKYMPFYIGKGTGNRAYEINRNETHRKVRQKIESFGGNIDIVILKDSLSEIDALCLESKLIDIFGLKANSGYLCNLDEGVNSAERRELYKDKYIKLSKIYKNSV